MSLYVQNLNNGDADEKGHLRLLGTLLSQSGVIKSGAFLVSQQAAPDMTVKVAGAAVGHDIAFKASDGALYHGWSTADENVTISANASGVAKKDAIVAYPDLSGGIATANNPGALKIISVRGSGTDTAPDNTQIQSSAVGLNPYVVLAHITVANGASSINSGNIEDQRPTASIDGEMVSEGAMKVNAGVISAGSFGTTGNISVTGLGFRPKLVEFIVLPNASGTAYLSGDGFMTEDYQCTRAGTAVESGPQTARTSNQSSCIMWVGGDGTSTTPNMQAERVSLDADGFTINVTTANNALPVAYKAFG